MIALLLGFLLAVSTLGHVSVQGSDPMATYYIQVYDPYEDMIVPVEVKLADDGEIFMEANRLAYFAGYDTCISSTSVPKGEQSYSTAVTIGRGEYLKRVNFGRTIGQYGHVYYPLSEAAEKMRFMYEYIPEGDVLLIIPFMADPENLVNDCKKLMGEHFEITFLDNTAGQLGVAMSVFSNVVGELRFDVVTGGYQQEVYGKALAGILDSGKSSMLEWLNDADELMTRLVKMQNFYCTDINGVKYDNIMFDVDTDGIIEAYGIMDDAIPGISVGDFWDTVGRVIAAQNANEVNLKAVRYGLPNGEVGNYNLAVAEDLLLSYYNENLSTGWAIAQDALIRGAQDVAKEMIADVVVGDINEAWIKFSKMAVDMLFGTDKSMGAVEQANACITIQNEAEDRYYELKRQIAQNGTDPQTAMELKYATILYIRACEYAYSCFAFDNDLKHSVEIMTEKCEAAIRALTAYTDSELLKPWSPCDPLYADQVKLEENYPTTVSGNKPNFTIGDKREKLQNGDERQGIQKKTLDYNAMSDGTYTVSVKKEDILATSDGWRISGDVYGAISFTEDEVNNLRVGGTIADITITSIEREEYSGNSYCYINGKDYISGYILCYDPTTKLWYHIRENDLREMVMIGRVTFRVAKDVRMTDNFTVFAKGGQPDIPVADPLDYWDLAKEYYFGPVDEMELIFTVKAEWVTAIDWQYKP